jgi:uncharacterized protein YbbC (DUF1343 family)
LKISFLFTLLLLLNTCKGQNATFVARESIVFGDQRMDRYLPLLENKNIALLSNHTSIIKNKHLLDTLLQRGINITKVFSPEHGFRGQAGAGELVQDGKDPQTGISIISLYGNHKKASQEDLQGIDIVLFDIQDVGARFYTYISTMGLMMEACAENDVQFIILDRPNPHGHYVDGPVLQKAYASFVGQYPIPVIHGMTVGEFAKMLLGEKWLKEGMQCRLQVITMENYSHTKICPLDIAPSPNLPNMDAISLYPSLCFFEGTPISIGRGTDFPFQVYGYPKFTPTSHQFVPKPIQGVALHPKCEGKICHAYSLNNSAKTQLLKGRLNLSWLINSYQQLNSPETFFTSFFNKLAGSNELSKQIKAGKTEAEIRLSWEKEIKHFKGIRKKYLLYKDFE